MNAHVPVLLDAALAALNIRPEGVYVDATFGRGGHSRAILAQLGPGGRLLALDRDPAAVVVGQAFDDERFAIVHAPFSRLGEVLDECAWPAVDGVLFDLGVSSPQLDEAARGFSFRHEADLDMRMDTSRGMTAADWLNTATEEEMGRVIRDLGEERFARQVARAIVAARAEQPIATTRQLATLVAGTVRTRERGQDPATRTFQAVRMHINAELDEIATALPQAASHLRPGGRLAVISFHSLEDRLTKQFMRTQSQGEQAPPEIPLLAADLRPGCLKLVGKATKADAAECARNPRARSATLRVAERTEAPWSS